MGNDLHIYDRASGELIVEHASVEFVMALAGVTKQTLDRGLERCALYRRGFFAFSPMPLAELDMTEAFTDRDKLYLVKVNEGDLKGVPLLFESVADIAAFFGRNPRTVMSAMWKNRRLPGRSRWAHVLRCDSRLAKVPRWDSVNGLWDLGCDLADLRPKPTPKPKAVKPRKRRPGRKVYVYDRVSGTYLATFQDVHTLAGLTGEDSVRLYGNVKKPINRRRNFIVGSWATPEAVDQAAPFSKKAVPLIIDRADGKGPLMVASQSDLAAWLGCTLNIVQNRLRDGIPMPGNIPCHRVTRTDPRLAEVPRWDPTHGEWTLSDARAELQSIQKSADNPSSRSAANLAARF